jgi:hypothetical protein
VIEASGLPLFYVVTVERFGVDLDALRRLFALTDIVGSPAVASVFSPDREFARPMMEATKLTVCEVCSLSDRSHPLIGLALEHRRKLDEAADREFEARGSQARAEGGQG